MTNANESKSARTQKTLKDTKRATVVALSDELNRRLAASPEAKPRKQKTENTIATKTDVPNWARNAEAGPPLVNAVETAAEPADAPSKPPKGRQTKPAKPAKSKDASPPAAPGSLRAIGEGWLGSLKAAGHTPSTISSYGNDLTIAYEHLGADALAADITEKQIAGFNTSKGVVKKANGKPKAQPTILKTRRALRLALVWAEQKGLIKTAPFPAKSPA